MKKFFRLALNCLASFLTGAVLVLTAANLWAVLAMGINRFAPEQAFDIALQAWGLNWLAGLFAVCAVAVFSVKNRIKVLLIRYGGMLGLAALAFFGLAVFVAALRSGAYWQAAGLAWFSAFMWCMAVPVTGYFVRRAIAREKGNAAGDEIGVAAAG